MESGADQALHFPYRSPQFLLTNATQGGLEPTPESRFRGARPHLLYSLVAQFNRQVIRFILI
jgi:hypothetical protein